VTFFSDGEDTLRQLQMYLSPQSEHILDSRAADLANGLE
jgi:hypothetical protein